MAVMQAKPSKEKKITSSLHPPYLEMIKEAITALKERSGSSQIAIAKYLEGKYKSQLQPNFRKMLSVQLRRFARSEKLVRVKNSYKVAAPEKKAPATSAVTKGPGRPPRKATAVGKVKKAAPAKAKAAKEGGAKKAKKVVAKGVVKKAKKVAAKSPAGKKRLVKSIKSPKKAPPAKRVKVSA